MTSAMKKQLDVEFVIKAGDIDFFKATPVISAAQKFVVPVPEFPDGGEPLVYPEGHEHAGEPVLAWDNKPIGEKGVVFWNAKDSCWQGAADDGTHVVIINQVSESQADLLYDKFYALGGAERITRENFKEFLAYAASIGLEDAYQSDAEYVRANMTPVKTNALSFEYAGVTMGFVKRDDRAIALAYYRQGPFMFINAEGVSQEMPNGGVIVQLGTAIHAVQPDIFEQTYRIAKGGREIRNAAVDIASAGVGT